MDSDEKIIAEILGDLGLVTKRKRAKPSRCAKCKRVSRRVICDECRKGA